MISKVYNYVNRVPYVPIWLAELFRTSSVKILVTLVGEIRNTLMEDLERFDVGFGEIVGKD